MDRHEVSYELFETAHNSSAPKPKGPAKSFLDHLNDLFLLETLGLVTSVGILIAMVVVLAKYDRKPQPSWRYMSLNSLISWLSTIFKACIAVSTSEALGQLKWAWFSQKKERPVKELRVYDNATRGPYGALELIWTLKARRFAVLGSLAVILALAVDPFAQNLIYHYQDMVDDSSQQAQLSKTDYYNSSDSAQYPNFGSGVDVVLKANVYSSLMNNDPERPWSTPQYTCPSGNCTWGPVAALEARAVCADITSFLSESCHESQLEGGMRTQNCTTSLPRNQKQAWFLPEINQGRIFVSNGIGLGRTPLAVNASRTLGTVQFIAQQRKIQDDWRVAPQNEEERRYRAMECAIVPMTRSFRVSIENNVYKDETLATYDTPAPSSLMRPIVYFEPPWGQDLGISEQGQIFAFGSLSGEAISVFVEDILTGYLSRRLMDTVYISTVDESHYAGRDIIQALGEGKIVGCGDDLPGRLNCSMQNIAQAITKSFRDSQDSLDGMDQSTRAIGRVRVSVTHIGVRWGWIALPILVLILGILVLTGAVWKTRRANLPKWKNDPLPLLFLYNGLDSLPPSASGLPVHGGLGHIHEIKLRLDTTDKGIVLR
ncbi:DUF3176 domain-containing protein [Aspergillus stella-maris]|uniref:DUF3176 domain-containing protein n=1 Tax=Aspergillus stella-maris TaxID=1810926 RepID=UPI003CCE4B2E